MKLTIVCDEQELDNEIGNIIKAKIRNVLRNDKDIRTLIGEVISVEIKRQVNQRFYGLDVSAITESIISGKVRVPTAHMIAGSTLRMIQEKVDAMFATDEEALKELLKKEMGEAKESES